MKAEKGFVETSTIHVTVIDTLLYRKLEYLGLIPNEVRNSNVGESNYSQHIIQPWSIWLDWDLNAWDADIVKRVLRTKSTDSRTKDYEKIIHICRERIRQLEAAENLPLDINGYAEINT